MNWPAWRMAKRTRFLGAAGTAPPTPPVDIGKLVTRMTWPKGRVIHRIHLDLYVADEFNPGVKGNARFSPIKDAAGASIPTLYGGDTIQCAAMETVFHDVPFAAGLKTFDKAKLIGQMISMVVPTRDLIVADLSSTALRKLGVGRNQLIDTEKDLYPHTRAWAESIHAQCPDVEGLCWVSRQDDRARAVVLFGDRAIGTDLKRHAASIRILNDPDVYADMIGLADRIGVQIVAGWV
jgi:hypothetical protein